MKSPTIRTPVWLRLLVPVCAVAVTLAMTASAYGQRAVGLIPIDPPAPPLIVDGIEILHVQGQVYMLVGGGGNVAAQVGDDGVMLVDSGAPGRSGALINAVRRLTNKPLNYLVNTSADVDHVGGNGEIVTAYNGVRGPRPGVVGGANPRGQNVGVTTIAFEGALRRMLRGDPDFPPMTGEAVPSSSFFTPKKEFYSNQEAIQLLAQPSSHTDGDAMVFFRGSDVVAAGDNYVTTSYPVIDVARGGSVTGVIEALNTLIDLAIPERNQMGGTRIIPGHGRISNESDVIEYRDMVTIVRDRVEQMVKEGSTLAQIKAAGVSLEYDGLYGATSGPWTTDMFIEAVYLGVGGEASDGRTSR